jgi:hypothetical protein
MTAALTLASIQSTAMSGEDPRPYGRQPVALRSLGEGIERQVERELRAAAALDHTVFLLPATETGWQSLCGDCFRAGAARRAPAGAGHAPGETWAP